MSRMVLPFRSSPIREMDRFLRPGGILVICDFQIFSQIDCVMPAGRMPEVKQPHVPLATFF